MINSSPLQKLLVYGLVPLLISLFSQNLHAQLRVEISGVGSQQYPIAIATFTGDMAGANPQDIASIVRSDLQRSGLFRVIDIGPSPLAENTLPALSDFKTRGADSLAVGSVTRLANGSFEIRYRLFDAVKQTQIDVQTFTPAASNLRLAAHMIADRIFEKITGERGSFATRIAYVVSLGRDNFELQVADSDGQNAQTALKSREPIISPAWSPDASKLAYVSFEDKKPVVFVHELETGKRTRVANFKGSNSAPAFSPEGTHLAVVLSKDGLAQMYKITIASGEAKRMAVSNGIDTEPIYAADGSLYFVSDRGGSPQIYKMSMTGEAARVTFKGDYNISPAISADGKTLAYVSRRGGKFQLYSLDLASGTETQLTDTLKDESPSFSPNGKQVIYATEIKGRGVLAVVSSDGRVKQTLSAGSGDIREPAWGPWTTNR
ncbi:MAG: Tol-Pal system beta propeller repeat protein TolB [Burkholderiaceae bacterium]|nr:Tol-Pal system beta propeller repeat protein TolB [Burkholderiaceae bacterium]